MTLKEAQRAFHQQRTLAVDELRKPYVKAVATAEREFCLTRPKRPTGPFRWFLGSDFERVQADWNARKARLISAKARMLEFEAEVANWQSPLQRRINAMTRQRCERTDPMILLTLKREQERKAEAKRVADALVELNTATGEKHELLLPGLFKNKWGGALLDSVDLAGRVFARASADRGYSFVLFPWRDEMSSFVGRPCWFWYNAFGEPRFAPQLGTRPPLPPSGPSGLSPIPPGNGLDP